MAEKEGSAQKRRSPRSAVLDSRPEYEALGKWVRAARESVGMKQKELSRALGKPEQFLNKVEAGRQRIDVVEFLDLCELLRIAPELTKDRLLAGEEGSSRMKSDLKQLG